MDILKGLFGLAVLVGIAWLFSLNRRAVDWKLVLTGIGLQVGFAACVLLGAGWVAWVQRYSGAGPTTDVVATWMLIVGILATLGAIAVFTPMAADAPQRANVRKVGVAMLFAAVLLALPFAGKIFEFLSAAFVKVLGFVNAGSGFIFGSLMDIPKFGFIFAFQVLPTIIFFAALMGVLYHLNVMQAIVRAMAWAITKVMRVSGAETTSVCASVFIGQTEAPLTVRPYIPKMTESELLTMMIGGMAHIAGGVLAAYVGMLGGGDQAAMEFYAKHLLAASIMAAPATLVIAKLLVPETGEPLTRGTVKMEVEKTSSNVIDAAAAGAADGLRLALNIGAMLLAFIALIALLNWPLGELGAVDWGALPAGLRLALTAGGAIVAAGALVSAANAMGYANVARVPSRPGVGGAVLALLVAVLAVMIVVWSRSEAGFTIDGWLTANAGRPTQLGLQALFGYLLAPLAWVIGVPWQDASTVGSLIGQKVVINEFVAYLQLADIVNGNVPGVELTPKGTLIATYALCGFANFSSIAIQIGGIGGLAPERRHDLARFGLRAVLGGSLATFMTATIAGVLSSYGA
jgi:CNT family concentrative nucleoside transporter